MKCPPISSCLSRDSQTARQASLFVILRATEMQRAEQTAHRAPYQVSTNLNPMLDGKANVFLGSDASYWRRATSELKNLFRANHPPFASRCLRALQGGEQPNLAQLLPRRYFAGGVQYADPCPVLRSAPPFGRDVQSRTDWVSEEDS
jgi:hypothetical protein